MSGATKVFFSVGRTGSDQQARFVSEIEKVLTLSGLEPRRAVYSSVQPLQKIVEELKVCDAAVIVAFERLHADRAIEFKQTQSEKKIRPLRATTVWNHIEAAMAYSLGLPILIIAENGCRVDGMLDEVSEWKVCWVNLDPAEFQSDRFQSIFADWRRRIDGAHQNRGGVDIDKLSQMKIVDLLRDLRPSHLLALGGGIAAVLTAGLALGRFLQ